MKRGALIVVEGIDRSGKSTQCKALVENLQRKKIHAEYMNFPDRKSEIGGVINSYITSKINLPDEAIHLLFSANRWEKSEAMKKLLENGTTLVVDRYCYSGVAYSTAKGLDLKWCKSSDIGLLKPDRVFFLTIPLAELENRNGFGNERYEVLDIQKKVATIYTKLEEDNWEIIDANRSLEDVQNNMLERAMEIVDTVQEPIGKMWIQEP